MRLPSPVVWPSLEESVTGTPSEKKAKAEKEAPFRLAKWRQLCRWTARRASYTGRWVSGDYSFLAFERKPYFVAKYLIFFPKETRAGGFNEFRVFSNLESN